MQRFVKHKNTYDSEISSSPAKRTRAYKLFAGLCRGLAELGKVSSGIHVRVRLNSLTSAQEGAQVVL